MAVYSQQFECTALIAFNWRSEHFTGVFAIYQY